MATVANIFVDQGSDYSNIITVTSTTGQALDLTGSFSQAFHSINQPLIGVDISDLTKPPIR